MFAVVFGKKYAKTNYQPSRCELDFKSIVIMRQLIPPVLIPTPGTDEAGKCPAVARGGGG